MSDRARLHCRARAHTCVSRLLVGSHACHYGMRVALRAPLGERVALPCCRPRGLRQGLIGAAPWGGTRVAARPWVRACGSTRAVGRTCGPSVLPPTRVAVALLVRPRGVALVLRRAHGCERAALRAPLGERVALAHCRPRGLRQRFWCDPVGWHSDCGAPVGASAVVWARHAVPAVGSRVAWSRSRRASPRRSAARDELHGARAAGRLARRGWWRWGLTRAYCRGP